MRSAAQTSVMLASAMTLGVSASAAGDVSVEADRLERLVRQDCGSCHGMTLKGGLGPDLTPARMAAVAPDALAAIILDGVPGSAMPPWRGLLKDDEARWIAAYLQKGARP